MPWSAVQVWHPFIGVSGCFLPWVLGCFLILGLRMLSSQGLRMLLFRPKTSWSLEVSRRREPGAHVTCAPRGYHRMPAYPHHKDRPCSGLCLGRESLWRGQVGSHEDGACFSSLATVRAGSISPCWYAVYNGSLNREPI